MNVSDFGKLLGRGERTVYRMAKRGELKINKGKVVMDSLFDNVVDSNGCREQVSAYLKLVNDRYDKDKNDRDIQMIVVDKIVNDFHEKEINRQKEKESDILDRTRELISSHYEDRPNTEQMILSLMSQIDRDMVLANCKDRQGLMKLKLDCIKYHDQIREKVGNTPSSAMDEMNELWSEMFEPAKEKEEV